MGGGRGTCSRRRALSLLWAPEGDPHQVAWLRSGPAGRRPRQISPILPCPWFPGPCWLWAPDPEPGRTRAACWICGSPRGRRAFVSGTKHCWEQLPTTWSGKPPPLGRSLPRGWRTSPVGSGGGKQGEDGARASWTPPQVQPPEYDGTSTVTGWLDLAGSQFCFLQPGDRRGLAWPPQPCVFMCVTGVSPAPGHQEKWMLFADCPAHSRSADSGQALCRVPRAGVWGSHLVTSSEKPHGSA